MTVLTIAYFFIMPFMLGFALSKLLKSEFDSIYKSLVMRLGFGLAAFPMLTVVLNTAHMPLHFLTYLFISMAYPAYYVAKNGTGGIKNGISEFLSGFGSFVNRIEKTRAGGYCGCPGCGGALDSKRKIDADGHSRYICNKCFKKYKSGTLRLDKKPDQECAKSPARNLNRDCLYFLLVLIFSISLLGLYYHGATVYEYFEDDDPYHHAEDVKYVALYNTYSISAQAETIGFGNYLEPYPPTYDVLMGILHQINNDLQGTLKFFNSLIVALSILFFYYFVERLTSDKSVALISALLLAVIPCYLSHFIWAQSYAVMIYPIALYFLLGTERVRGEGAFGSFRDKMPSIMGFALFSASIFVVQTSAALIFLLISGIFFLGSCIGKRNLQVFMIAAVILGLVVSLVYWVPTEAKFKSSNMATMSAFSGILNVLAGKSSDLKLGNTAYTRTYSLEDFIIAPKNSNIDQATGVGAVLFFVFAASLAIIIFLLIREKFKNSYLTTLLLWLAFTVVGVQSNTLPINVMPHRFWAFFAMPLVIISAIGIMRAKRVEQMPHGMRLRNSLKILIGIVIFAGILATSLEPKISVQTAIWPPGVGKWSSQEQLDGYVYLKNNFNNAMVFPLCEDDEIPISFNQMNLAWDEEVFYFRNSLVNRTFGELQTFLREKGYEYYTITSNCQALEPYSKIGAGKLQELIESGENPVYSNPGFMLFRVG